MKTWLATIGGVILLGLTAVGIGVAATSRPSLISPGDYQSSKSTIARQAAKSLQSCAGLAEGARLICAAEVRAEERVALAELDHRYRGTEVEAKQLEKTRASARYDVARVKCAALTGFKRDSCIVSAHADKARALMAMQ